MSDESLQPILVLLSESAAGNPCQYMVEKTFVRHQLAWRYLSVEVAEDALEEAARGIRAMGFSGGNCARPHNRRIGAFLDRLGTTAERAGTVNLIRREDDALIGENTEGLGVVQAVRAVREASAGRVLLFGAGDLARAVALELCEAGTDEIVVVNRTEERGLSLVQLLKEHHQVESGWLSWDTAAEAPGQIDLLINATPVGTDGDAPPVDWQLLSADAAVVDVNLEETVPPLLQEAAQRGLATVNGLDVFLEQAAANFRLWTGIDPERTVMREAVEEYLEL